MAKAKLALIDIQDDAEIEDSVDAFLDALGISQDEVDGSANFSKTVIENLATAVGAVVTLVCETTDPTKLNARGSRREYWDEAEHPREEDGKFGDKGGGSSGTADKGGKSGKVRFAPKDPTVDSNSDGVTDAARVGVPGDSVPPPPDIPRVEGLLPDEKAVEERFTKAYEDNPKKFVDDYRSQVAASKTPNTFSTDDAKMLSPDYRDTVEGKALYNVAVHQAANAIAKQSFLEYMDQVVAKLPEGQRTVMVTAGGCASGKGYSLNNVESAKAVAAKVGAVWDTAGEQNGTELPWVLKEASARGIKAVFAYVDADPTQTFSRVVSRAAKEGRMVDVDLFADSYAIGAKNFANFSAKNSDKASFIYLSGRTAKPTLLDRFPKEALVDRDTVFNAAQSYLKDHVKEIPPYVLRGATVGHRAWRGATKMASLESSWQTAAAIMMFQKQKPDKAVDELADLLRGNLEDALNDTDAADAMETARRDKFKSVKLPGKNIDIPDLADFKVDLAPTKK